MYTQGYTDETLSNFELSMTTPSIIYDQERIELMKQKAELAGTLLEQGLVPSDWIYHNIYHFSEDQFDEYRDLAREDAKRKFRLAQIEAEGNDPVETGQSYGTPHDLATLYGKGRMYTEPTNVPDPSKYAGDEPQLGRPEKTNVKRNTQADNFGKDRLGVKRMKDTDKNDSTSIKPKFNGNSPLALEIQKEMGKKKLVFEQNTYDSPLLDENQLKK